MPATRILLVAFCMLVSSVLPAQQRTAVVSGKVVDAEERPLAMVTVTVLGRQSGVLTSDSGSFSIKVPAAKAIALTFSFTGFHTVQRSFYLTENEQEKIVVRLESNSKVLQEVIVKDERERTETGLIRLNPKHALTIPSATGGVESLIKIFAGSNNELTSQYTVRGGNYDENLVYVNDFEIFRPYLVRSGQQEGLSFINPELTGGLSFYNGGFQAKYGDKMSSVLDIQYKKPKSFAGSAYIGLLEQGFYAEGVSKNKKFSYLAGVRNRSNRNLLSAQETKGNYIPSSSDIQALFTYQVNSKWQLELLGNLSATKFTLIPEEAKLTSSVLSPLFSTNLGLDIYFEGNEQDRYQTHMLGLSAVQQVNKKLKLKWMLSRFENKEQEACDITGAYLFGERSFDKSQPGFGSIINPLGAGVFINHARNTLAIENWNISHKGEWNNKKHFVQWGISAEKTLIADRLNEWEAQDSAGYNLPYHADRLQLYSVRKSTTDLDVSKLSGYLQDNISFGSASHITVQGGIRFNYNGLNNEFLLSPRLQMSWMPDTDKDWVLKLAAGAYNQPPFYRELRRYDGSVNTAVKAQRSWQVVAGADHNFQLWERPSRITIEAYYKHLTHVDPYDIDNVRIRYFGDNSAKAYATGIEMRLFSELVKDAESWVSVGLMRTMEKINDFHYYRYKNAGGELITAQTEDQVVADSTRFDKGWMRRPTDRLLTFGMFFQDYLSTNKNFKVHLNMIYGSSMPYNIPGSVRYRNGLIIDPYMRVDIGFSALLLSSGRSSRRSHHPFRKFDNIWASLEVFNLLDRDNTISYLLIKDFSNTVYAIPNRLTPRLFNFKILARF
ncbi:TonB-dependent receptor [Agriterribacter sp.]|uniref:TonB-dependent receptor n=1 Tax=Agriterribacter sp. TaxID=2821509 RepID=UPI002CE9C875|nr:carboxypeptidase-like regulatory domain-containing protein [Agriterribacter sp.]HTN05742.1 carboxypeptidase-like regulatory domain-containing protein [Agriterribacter sp.]